jgi:TfoX/Sxy family transcriptional regulator of competence genes
MATRQGTIDFILEQIEGAGAVSARKMFGEYALYLGEKTVALVCDGQLFVKPTAAGREFIGEVVEGYAFTGAKASFLITGDRWEDRDWLKRLIQITAEELPEPKKRAAKKKAAL